MRRIVLGIFAAIGIVAALMVLGAGVAVWHRVEPAVPAEIDRPDRRAGPRPRRGPKPGRGERARSPAASRRCAAFSMRSSAPATIRASRALYVQLGQDLLGLARVQEVRDAVQAFRAKGKFAIAFSESFGEFGGGTRPYYLATAFDEIWLQPLGSVGLTGLRAEIAVSAGHARPARDRAQFRASRGIQDRGEHPDRNRDDRAAARRARGAARRGGRSDRARHRRGPPSLRERGRGLIDRGPLFADEAKEAHIVDRIGYRDEALAEAQRPRRLGRRAGVAVALSRGRRPAACEGPTIALIYGAGLIVQGSAGDDPLPGSRDERARGGPRLPRRVPRRRGARDPVPHRQPRRLGGRLGNDLARGRAGARARQAGHRVDGRCRRLRRLLHRRAGRQDRRRAGDTDRLDRRPRRQARRRRTAQQARRHCRSDRSAAPKRRCSAPSRIFRRPSGRGSTPFSTRPIAASRSMSRPAAI